jgi:hypothetical protein
VNSTYIGIDTFQFNHTCAGPTPTPGPTGTPTPTPTPTPTIRTYDTGSGTETVPINATSVKVEIWYPGGGGSRTSGTTAERGGGSGAYSIKTVPLTSINWGQTFAYNCGTAGLGATGATGNGGAASGGSITDNLTNITVTFVPATAAQGGVNSGTGVGGTVPSGGDTNTAGNSTTAPTGAGAPNGGGNVPAGVGGSTPGGGGGGGATSNGNGANGASGRCRFTYTIANPSPTPTPTPTATPTPGLLSVTGTVTYCPNPALPPVSAVTMSLTGPSPAPTSVLTNGSGVYTFSGLTAGASYTVTPTKTAKTPGTSGLNTSDSIAIQRHFLVIGTPLSGCRLLAADTNDPPNGVNTTDAIAVQRFFLALTTGLAQTGRFKFTPASTSYAPIVGNMTNQNYNAIILGDAATTFVAPRPGGGTLDSEIENEVPSTVASVVLPQITLDSRTHFSVAVTTSAIDVQNKLVGFQGDLTFDERVISFEEEPVSGAGLTAENWSVAGNVLDGPGPIRTLRISAFSTNFVPLSGSGTLFELKMKRVNKNASSTPLSWAPGADQFIFIDADVNAQKPINAAPGRVVGR